MITPETLFLPIPSWPRQVATCVLNHTFTPCAAPTQYSFQLSGQSLGKCDFAGSAPWHCMVSPVLHNFVVTSLDPNTKYDSFEPTSSRRSSVHCYLLRYMVTHLLSTTTFPLLACVLLLVYTVAAKYVACLPGATYTTIPCSPLHVLILILIYIYTHPTFHPSCITSWQWTTY